jgi:hypothetical protein
MRMCEAMHRHGISARSDAQPSPQSAKLDETCAALCAARCSEQTAPAETAEANLSFPMADAALKLSLVFTVGPTNTSRCIQGSEPIRSESACKAAAFAMGLPFEDVIEAGPSGCHMTEDGVIYNPLDQGEPHAPVIAVICLPLMQHAQNTRVEFSAHLACTIEQATCKVYHAPCGGAAHAMQHTA